MKFPHPEQTDSHGLLCAGGQLSCELLIEAYSQGIFPWPQEDIPLLWFCPPERGVLFFKNFHIPKSVKKIVDKNEITLTMNQDFSSVIENCSKIPRSGESDTWILPEMVEVYKELHQKGLALSVEAWRGEKLVGGLYGVLINGVFSGESMFFFESGASKLCLIHLVEHLKSQGHEWMDIQMVTPILEQFGGEYIARKKFLDMLPKAVNS